MSEPPVIGIDLGTSYSRVAVFEAGKLEIIANEQGQTAMPSYVAFTDTERLLGHAAKNQAETNPKNTVFNIKNLMGRCFDDPWIQFDKEYRPFRVINYIGHPEVEVRMKDAYKLYCFEEITSVLLKELRELAADHLNYPVEDAVITVPAHFSNAQRQAVLDAGVIAGLKVRRLVSEHSAAALAYGVSKNSMKFDEARVLIIDIGAGAMDVCTMMFGDGIYKVKSAAGSNRVSGDEFTNRLVKFCVQEFRGAHGKDLSEDARAMQRVKTACEAAKITLSSSTTASVELHSLFEGHDFSVSITRAQFETLCNNLYGLTLEVVYNALRSAGMDKYDINDIVLIGGATRMPLIQKLLKAYFVDKELNLSMNPDETVVCGAAFHAARLSDTDDALVVDVVPSSIAMKTEDESMETLFKRNTALPARLVREITTRENDQHTLSIEVYERGENIAEDEFSTTSRLGVFTLTGLPASPMVIEFTFEVDHNGILHVLAVDRTAGRTNSLRVTKDIRKFSSEDIDRMVHEARQYRNDYDGVLKSKARAKKALKGLCGNLQKAISSEMDRLNSALGLIQDTLQWLGADGESANLEEYRAKRAELEDLCEPIISMYKL